MTSCGTKAQLLRVAVIGRTGVSNKQNKHEIILALMASVL